MKPNTALLLAFVLSGCAPIVVDVASRESALNSLGLAVTDREGITQAIADDEHFRPRILLSAKIDDDFRQEYGLDLVALTFDSPDCGGRVRETASVTRNSGGWHLSRGERLLGKVVLRGPITCRDADATLAIFETERGGRSEAWGDSATPYAVGLAYSFIAADDLGGRDEQLFAVLLSRDGSQRIFLIKNSQIVDVRMRAVIN